ncbi:hypothetical protein [Ekhidna sp.]
MNVERFIKEIDGQIKGRNRTVNIKDSLHTYYKHVAMHYDVSMATLITNVLLDWKDEYEELIKEDMMKKLQK